MTQKVLELRNRLAADALDVTRLRHVAECEADGKAFRRSRVTRWRAGEGEEIELTDDDMLRGPGNRGFKVSLKQLELVRKKKELAADYVSTKMPIWTQQRWSTRRTWMMRWLRRL